jgi:hypothetical protein
VFGDCSLVGDARWAGTYGVVGDYIARDNCRSPPVNLRSRGASIVIQDMQNGFVRNRLCHSKVSRLRRPRQLRARSLSPWWPRNLTRTGDKGSLVVLWFPFAGPLHTVPESTVPLIRTCPDSTYQIPFRQATRQETDQARRMSSILPSRISNCQGPAARSVWAMVWRSMTARPRSLTPS